ncbi:MAG: hypothetical protein L6R40_000813 [Gallowayella cf. fulva]|nr:MAG: hypothetical protein L6R40_000813 [Xanthomendoza cf. fulva]
MASPVVQTSHPRPLDCKVPKTGIASKCWGELKADQYMQRWAKLNYPKTCKKGDDFSTCFNRLAAPGNGPQNCTSLASKHCNKLNPSQHFLSPQWFYGSYNSWAVPRYRERNAHFLYIPFDDQSLTKPRSKTNAPQNQTAIHAFLSNFANATRYLAAENPSSIAEVIAPVDIDSFTAASNVGLVNIDVALNGLLRSAPDSPQHTALQLLVIAETTPKSTLQYNSNDVANAKPSVAEIVVRRLEELLRYVETDLEAFLAMAKEGAFSVPEVVSEAALVKSWWPKAPGIVSLGDGEVVEGTDRA